jgi:hypothetical protein
MLSFVGKAAAIGLGIDIPIIIRSLSASLFNAVNGTLPFNLAPDLYETIDAGVHFYKPFRLVGRYICNWWDQKQV